VNDSSGSILLTIIKGSEVHLDPPKSPLEKGTLIDFNQVQLCGALRCANTPYDRYFVQTTNNKQPTTNNK